MSKNTNTPEMSGETQKTAVLESFRIPMDNLGEELPAIERYRPEWLAGRRSAEQRGSPTNNTNKASLGNTSEPSACNIAGDSGPSDPLTILKKNNTYHLFFNPYQIECGGWDQSYLPALIGWLSTLTEENIVYFYQSGNLWYVPTAASSLIAIESCKANTIYVLDHMTSYGLYALACSEIFVKDTGAIEFRRPIPADTSECDAAYIPYVRSLLNKATQRKLLTEDEVESIFSDDRIVLLTANDIRARQSSDVTTESTSE